MSEARKRKKPCIYFQTGKCAWGDKCKDLHEPSPKGSTSKSKKPKNITSSQSSANRTRATSSASRVAAISNRTVSSSTVPASTIIPSPSATVASRSPTPPDVFGKAPSQQLSANLKSPCHFFQLGMCSNGSKCEFSHGNLGESQSAPVASTVAEAVPIHNHVAKENHNQDSRSSFSQSFASGSSSSPSAGPSTGAAHCADYRPNSPFGYEGVRLTVSKDEREQVYNEEDDNDGHEDQDEIDDLQDHRVDSSQSKANLNGANRSISPSSSIYQPQLPAIGSSTNVSHTIPRRGPGIRYEESLFSFGGQQEHRENLRVYPVVSEQPKPVPYVTEIIPHWSQFADPRANGDIPFCKQLAQNQCVLRNQCRFRHSLTIDEYTLLFKDQQPNLWTVPTADGPAQQGQNVVIPQNIPNPVTFQPPPAPLPSAPPQKVCTFYPLGKCRNGAACPYVHVGSSPTNDVSSKSHSSASVFPASDSNYTGDPRSPSPTQDVCRYFESDGYCKRGDQCFFRHITGSDVKRLSSHPNSNKQQESWSMPTNPDDVEEETGQNDGDGWGALSGGGGWETTHDDHDRWGATPKATNVNGWGESGEDNNGRDNADIGDSTLSKKHRKVDDSDNGGWSSSASGRKSNHTGRGVCYAFLKGTCQRGARCRFEHDREKGPKESDDQWNNHSSSWSEQESQHQKPSSNLCKDFKNGTCTRGNRCRYSHERPQSPYNEGIQSWGEAASEDRVEDGAEEATEPNNLDDPNAEDITLQPDEQNNDVAESWDLTASNWPDGSNPTIELSKKQQPCKAFGQGFCRHGDSCFFLHDLPVDQLQYHADRPGDNHEDADETEAEAEEKDTSSQELPEAETEGIVATDVARPPTTPEVIEVPEKTPEHPNIERFIYNCTIRFNRDCSPEEIMTAADSRKMVLSNLPPDTTTEEISQLVRRFGDVLEVVLVGEGVDSATLSVEFGSGKDALAAVQQLNGQTFASQTISARLDSRSPVFARSPLHSPTLLVSWPSPTLTAWTFYDTITLAKQAASRLDGMTFENRQLHAFFDKPGKRGPFAVRITGLPPATSMTEVENICKDPRSVLTTLGEPTYTTSPLDNIRDELQRFGKVNDFAISDEENSLTRTVAYATMETYSFAEEAARNLNGTKPDYLGKQDIKVKHIYLARRKVLSKAFECVVDGLNFLREHYKGKCIIIDLPQGEFTVVQIRASIEDSTPFSEANAKLNALIDGCLITSDEESGCVWDDYLDLPSSSKALATINDKPSDMPSFIHCDRRLKRIRVYGSSDGQKRGKSTILRLIKKAQEQRRHLSIERYKIGPLLAHGLAALEGALGSNKVTLDVVNSTLVVRGEANDLEKAQLVLSVMTSSPSESTVARSSICPICERVPVSPVKLTCSHAYCQACLQFALSSTARSESTFFTCISNANMINTAANNSTRCGVPISYTVVRDTLQLVTGFDFLKAAFEFFIRGLGDQFFFCPTPDCPAIYRAGEHGIIIRCTICSVDICSHCCSRMHDGSLCAADPFP